MFKFLNLNHRITTIKIFHNSKISFIKGLEYNNPSPTIIKNNWRFTDDTNNPFNKLTLQIIGSIAEFERNMIKMRQAEGIAIAKQKGVYSKERCKKISLSQQEELKADIKNKVRVCEILKKYGITKPTYYRYKENFGL